MGLAERLQEPPAAHHNAGCGVGRWLADAPQDDAEALRDALDDRRWRHTDLARVLQDAGVDVSDQTVARHRNGDCRCEEVGLT